MRTGLGVLLLTAMLAGGQTSGAEAQQVPARRFILVPAAERLAPPESGPRSGDVAARVYITHATFDAPRDSVVRAHPAKMVVGGLIGGAAGLYLGGVFGANLSGGGLSSNDVSGGGSWNDLGNALLFGAIGESLGMALGIHMANDRRGSYWRDVVAVAGTGVIMLIPAVSIDNAWVIIPVAQLWSGIVVERRTTR